MRIIDCITFCNTLEVLDLRLHVLAGVVDQFVIAEAPVTFSGRPKKLYFNENREIFDEFSDRITHVVGPDVPNSPDLSRHDNVYRRTERQKNAVKLGLIDCAPDDIILFSDADEIPDPEQIERFEEIRFGEEQLPIGTFYHTMYYWYLNWYWTNRWPGTIITRYKHFDNPYQLRQRRREGYRMGGGWHFTLTGDTERRVENLLGYEDKDRVFKGQVPNWNLGAYIEDRIANRLGFGMALRDKYNTKKAQPVEIDGTFPQYLQENQWKYRDLISLP